MIGTLHYTSYTLHTTGCRLWWSRSLLLQAGPSRTGRHIHLGDFKYHDFFLTENRIMIADIGHYESEQFTKEIFYEILTKKISKFAVQFSEINTNPIKYL